MASVRERPFTLACAEPLGFAARVSRWACLAVVSRVRRGDSWQRGRGGSDVSCGRQGGWGSGCMLTIQDALDGRGRRGQLRAERARIEPSARAVALVQYLVLVAVWRAWSLWQAPWHTGIDMRRHDMTGGETTSHDVT